jgi:hypothetical protein
MALEYVYHHWKIILSLSTCFGFSLSLSLSITKHEVGAMSLPKYQKQGDLPSGKLTFDRIL